MPLNRGICAVGCFSKTLPFGLVFIYAWVATSMMSKPLQMLMETLSHAVHLRV